MYAVIETGGKQYKVQAGDTIYIEKLDVNAEDKITFDKVLLIGDDKKGIKTGDPYIKGAKVTGKSSRTAKTRR